MRKGKFSVKNVECDSNNLEKIRYIGQIREGVFSMERDEYREKTWRTLLKEGQMVLGSGEKLKGKFYGHKWFDNPEKLRTFIFEGELILTSSEKGETSCQNGKWLCEDARDTYRIVKSLGGI